MKMSTKQIEEKFNRLSEKVTEAVAATLMFTVLPKSVTYAFRDSILTSVLRLLPPDQEEARQEVYDVIVDQVAKNETSYGYIVSRLTADDRKALGARFADVLGDRIKFEKIEDLMSWVCYAANDQKLLRAAFLATNLSFETWVKNRGRFEADHFRLYSEMCARSAKNLYEFNNVVQQVLEKIPDYSDFVYVALRQCRRSLIMKHSFNTFSANWDTKDPCCFGLDVLEVNLLKATTVDEFLSVSIDALSYANHHQNVGLDTAVNAMMRAHSVLPNMDFSVAMEVLDTNLWNFERLGVIAGTAQNLRTHFPEKAAEFIRQGSAEANWSALLEKCSENLIIPEYLPELQKLAFQKLQEQYSQ